MRLFIFISYIFGEIRGVSGTVAKKPVMIIKYFLQIVIVQKNYCFNMRLYMLIYFSMAVCSE